MRRRPEGPNCITTPGRLRHIGDGKCASPDEKRTQKSRRSQCQSHSYITRTLQFQKATLLLFFRRSLIQTASKRAREAAASQPDPIRVCKNNISEKKYFWMKSTTSRAGVWFSMTFREEINTSKAIRRGTVFFRDNLISLGEKTRAESSKVTVKDFWSYISDLRVLFRCVLLLIHSDN